MPTAETLTRKAHLEQIVQSIQHKHFVSTLRPPVPADPLGRKNYLQGLLQTAQQPVTRKIFAPERTQTYARTPPRTLPEGWYGEGFFPDKIYRVEDLIAVWRGSFPQYGFTERAPDFDWFMRPHLLHWLKEEGHKHCQNAVLYTLREWPSLRFEMGVDADVPTLNIIYGYRRRLKRLLDEEQNGTEDWKDSAATWGGVNEETSSTVSFF
jgi:hypothetical protein